MTLHVYALTRHPGALPTTLGIDGAELRAVEIGSVETGYALRATVTSTRTSRHAKGRSFQLHRRPCLALQTT